jgi:PLP dependent protein
MSDIAANILSLRQELPHYVKLVAVSKTMPVSAILEAYNTGHRCFGENKVQELVRKKDLLPDDIEWHLIGHLQGNKVRYIMPFIAMIQSVDSFKLLAIINHEASKINRTIDCLLQVHIATEETKFGFSKDELSELTESQEFKNMKNVSICGVMGMATFTSDTAQIGREFVFLRDCFEILKNGRFSTYPQFKEISMGMSGDYKIAVNSGSTIVRIGSLIFGTRT